MCLRRVGDDVSTCGPDPVTQPILTSGAVWAAAWRDT